MAATGNEHPTLSQIKDLFANIKANFCKQSDYVALKQQVDEITPTPEYILPTASATTKGGVKIGEGLSMSGDTLNADAVSYTLPTASLKEKGGIKTGNGIVMSGEIANVDISSANGTLPMTKLPDSKTVSFTMTGLKIDALKVAVFGPVVVLDFNVSTTVSVSTGENKIGTLSSSYRPSSQKAAFLTNSSGNNVTAFVSASGTVGLWADRGGTISGRTTLVYMAGK